MYEFNAGELHMNDLAKLFKALSDESRLRILNLVLSTGGLCVCDIESTTGFTQTKVSRHLAYLRNAGLLKDRRQGLWMLYSVAAQSTDEQRQLMSCLKSILKGNAAARRDIRLLETNIRKGCCATFTQCNVQKAPAVSAHT